MAITSRALAFASRWFDPSTVAGVFEPLVADWQREWIEATRSRRWIVHVKGMLAFSIAAIVSTPAIVRTRAPRTLTDQIARRVTIVAAIGTAILMWPFVSNAGPVWSRAAMLLAVIPQALTLVFPFALISGVDAIRHFNGIDSRMARATVSKLATFGLVFVFFLHGWVTPAANQIYREMSFRSEILRSHEIPADRRTAILQRGPAPGVRELTNSELVTRLTRAVDTTPGTYESAMAKSVRREISTRAALAVLPVLLVWRRWRALGLPAGRWFSAQHAAIATISTLFAFGFLRFSDRFIEEGWELPVGSGPWITLALLLFLSILRVAAAERAMRDA